MEFFNFLTNKSRECFLTHNYWHVTCIFFMLCLKSIFLIVSTYNIVATALLNWLPIHPSAGTTINGLKYYTKGQNAKTSSLKGNRICLFLGLIIFIILSSFQIETLLWLWVFHDWSIMSWIQFYNIKVEGYYDHIVEEILQHSYSVLQIEGWGGC